MAIKIRMFSSRYSFCRNFILTFSLMMILDRLEDSKPEMELDLDFLNLKFSFTNLK